VGKRAAKGRRREEPKLAHAGEPEAAAALETGVRTKPERPEPALPAPPALNSPDEEPRRPSLIPGATQVTAEQLAAHDSFVRSPSAVVESLGIRVATAVARKLASTPPPPASLPPPAPASDGQSET